MTDFTVEKIGGTSMSRADELVGTLFTRDGTPEYGRIFVVSAFGGITDLLLENKKSGEPGAYGLFVAGDTSLAWSDALDKAHDAMAEAHGRLLEHAADRRQADEFLRERIEGVRNCLIDLQRLCSYGHFRLDQHVMTVRELLSGLGEAHSAHVTALLLQRSGVDAVAIDLTGWRDERQPDLDGRIADGLAAVDPAVEMPIVTGYAQCREGLMRAYDRGYSEVTFSRVAAHIGAREAVIHKEFHLSSADPKVVGGERVRKIGETNYDLADQLSNLGMEAIHPSAAKVLRQADIPLRVANAFEPEDPGTLFCSEIGGPARVEMVTGLDVFALEVFEQDMVGVKGYDARILEAMARHKAWIVSKTSNANTITHHLNAPLKIVQRAEAELAEAFPSAAVTTRRVGLVSAIGRNLKGLSVAQRGLAALAAAGIDPIGMLQPGRCVDVQFIVATEERDAAIRALHEALVEEEGAGAPSELPEQAVNATGRPAAAATLDAA